MIENSGVKQRKCTEISFIFIRNKRYPLHLNRQLQEETGEKEWNPLAEYNDADLNTLDKH